MEALLILSFIVFIPKVFSDDGVLFGEIVTDTSLSISACVFYNPEFHELPNSLEAAKPWRLADYSEEDGCNDTTKYSGDVKGKMVAVVRGNCSFSEKGLIIQENGGIGLLIVNTPNDSMTTPGINKSFDGVNITVAMISNKDFEKLKTLGINKSEFQLFAPGVPRFDFNLFAIWIIAMFCVTVGGHWAGNVTFSLFLRKRPHLMRPGEEKIVDAHPQSEEEGEVTLSVKHLIILVVIMCAVIVALYFLFDYLVYLVIALFCIAGSLSLYMCIWPWIQELPPHNRIPTNRIPLLSSQPQIKALLLLAACCAFGITWAVERKASYAWILQDMMGLAFCIHMLKTIRLPSLKVCTILLVLLFFYDIFFVFITPLFTKNGESVMVQIATGGDGSSGEQLPMVFIVPRFSHSIAVMCYRPYSLLGFGDIIVPGLLVSFCSGFGHKVRRHRLYFIAVVLAYGVGLVITFVALGLMKTGQPALLYLVPCTLITAVVVGWRRKELRVMWRGEPSSEKTEGNNSDRVSEPSYQTPPTLHSIDSQEEEEMPSVVRDTDERQLLINRQPTR